MKFQNALFALGAFLYAGTALAQSKPLPEPGAWALMGIGLVALAARYFAKKR